MMNEDYHDMAVGAKRKFKFERGVMLRKSIVLIYNGMINDSTFVISHLFKEGYGLTAIPYYFPKYMQHISIDNFNFRIEKVDPFHILLKPTLKDSSNNNHLV